MDKLLDIKVEDEMIYRGVVKFDTSCGIDNAVKKLCVDYGDYIQLNVCIENFLQENTVYIFGYVFENAGKDISGVIVSENIDIDSFINAVTYETSIVNWVKDNNIKEIVSWSF